MKPTSTGSAGLETPAPTPVPTSPAIVERCKALISKPLFDAVMMGVPTTRNMRQKTHRDDRLGRLGKSLTSSIVEVLR
ncbi:MAG TPA: hypothetical protein VGA66_10255 [Mycobacterium sp.]